MKVKNMKISLKNQLLCRNAKDFEEENKPIWRFNPCSNTECSRVSRIFSRFWEHLETKFVNFESSHPNSELSITE